MWDLKKSMMPMMKKRSKKMHWPQAASAGQYVRAQLCFLHQKKCILCSQSTHVESCYFATERNFTDLDDIEQGFSFNFGVIY